MKTIIIVSIAVLSFLLGGTGSVFAASAEAVAGNIRVLQVKGAVTVSVADKPAAPLQEGAFIQQYQVIKTYKDAQILLLFSNGTQVTVQPDSVFSVDQFLQTPFDSRKTDYSKIKSEPSVSQTKLFVSKGSIIADVAKLKKGSSFKIGTPRGVAKIHGTLIQVTVNTTAGGSVSVTINLPQGLADFASTNGQQVTLSNGQTVTVSSDPVTGTMTIGGVSPLNAQTIQQIQSLAEQVTAAIPALHAFEGVPDGAPEQLGIGEPQAGVPSGDQSTGNVGTAPGGGGGGGGGSGGGIILDPVSPSS